MGEPDVNVTEPKTCDMRGIEERKEKKSVLTRVCEKITQARA